jgi:hypothetical protein
MSGISIRPFALVVALCASGAALLAAPVYVAARREAASAMPCRTITPLQEAAILSAGAKVLRHVAQARADIGTRNAGNAAAQIDRTEELLDVIQANLPTTDAREWIQVARKHLEYASPREVLPDLIPIYASLKVLHNSMPTEAAEHHLGQAREYLQAGDKEKAGEELQATARALQDSEVELPLESTRQMIATAGTDLKREKWDAADRALQSAEDSTVYLSVAYEQPLFAAKALIWQTVLDLDAADNDLARSDFEGAIGYLELASQSGDASVRKAASRIYRQSKVLQKDLESGASAASGARRLWKQTRALAERSLEYLAAGWENYHSEDRLKSSLIAARLHLANAGIDLFTGNEDGRAREELLATGRFLEQAAGRADREGSGDSYRHQIADLQAQIKELGADPAAVRESRYAVLQKTLQNMIRSL